MDIKEVKYNFFDHEPHYKFEFRLYIKHPCISLATIENHIPLPISNGWSVGSKRTNIHGELIGNIKNETYWNYREYIENRRDFFNYSIIFLSELIEKYKLDHFFKEISSTQGEIHLVINLFKDTNIGDLISQDQMFFLIKHNINLAIEYFPGHNLMSKIDE